MERIRRSDLARFGLFDFDMPTIVCEVFKAKLAALLHNLRHGKYFGGDTTVFIIHVIEYQERGLPHAHIVLRLQNASHVIKAKFNELTANWDALSPADRMSQRPPTMDDAAAFWVDQHICAEMPKDPEQHLADYLPDYRNDPKFVEDLKLYEGIRTSHVHRHSGSHLVNGCMDSKGQCKKGYTNTTIREKTTFSNEGFPLYRRRKEEDLLVVPYNREIFLDWGCGHINCEFSGQTYTILYLYKYLFKGAKKVTVTFGHTDGGPPPPLITAAARHPVLALHAMDEIGRYIRGRRLCSMDAMWRLMGFHTYPASDPPVTGIKVRSPNFMLDYTDKRKLTDLIVYFARPAVLSGLKFTDFFSQFTTVRLKPTRGTENQDWYQLSSLDSPRFGRDDVFIRRRGENTVLCRLHSVAHSSGDLWFQRLLLQTFPYSTLNDMYCGSAGPGSQPFASFQQAAVDLDIAQDRVECLACFEGAVSDGGTPRTLRALLVSMAINAFPITVIYERLDLRAKMFEIDWIDRHHSDDTINADQQLLKDLRDRFAEHGHAPSDHSLPDPKDESTEKDRFLLRYPVEQQRRLYAELSDRRPLNQEQSGIFKIIVTAIQDQQKDADGTFLTLEGSGGTGKTELAKHIMAFMRSQTKADDGQPYLIHTVCSTALGAQNYPQGECTTAHSFFVLPVEQEYDKEIDDDCMQCLAATKPQRHELIQAIDVIFWDEAMSNHRECLEAVMREFDNLKGMFASSVRKQP